MSSIAPVSFHIIPVLDLHQGIVVHARRGDRQTYQPLQTRLCEGSSAPLQLVQAFLKLHAFQTFYIADLDAIQKRGSHRELIVQLCTLYPHLQWWVDDGSTQPWAGKPLNLTQVLGTESNPELQCFNNPDHYVLSLDQRGDQLLGNRSIHLDCASWPKRIIAMTLSQVGANEGPNIEVLNHYLATHPQHDWYASGGVRHLEDLRRLKSMGTKGVLVASALHSGQLTSDELKRVMC